MDEDRPTPGIAEELSPGLRRVLADNPSPMTYWGTNTYLVGTRDIAVIDPGPDDEAHLAAILGALDTGQRVSHVLVTHSHVDHSSLAQRLAHETGAQVHGFGPSGAGRSAIMTRLAASGLEDAGEGVDAGFSPDVALSDGMVIEAEGWALEALWTPGHLGNHMAFAMGDTVFCGDLVMGWASSLVAPPDGDLTDFMASCRRLRTRGAKVFHSGHGAPIQDPMGRLDWLLAHREGREASILDALRDGPADAQSLARRVYTDTPSALLGAAARNVLAHLIDLHGRNLVAPEGNLTATSRFELS